MLPWHKIRNSFGCVFPCSICAKNFIEFEVIITELCSDLSSLNLLAQQVVTSQPLLSWQFIFFTLSSIIHLDVAFTLL